MVETENLRTASLYINNQLLSRGLLRDGQHIDFTDPGREDADVATTMGRIMSVVNDLILRRDRDAEQRESLSSAMRSLRAENLKHASDLTRLSDKHVEAQRKLDIAESSDSALKTQLKSADAAARGLKEELARTKALVAQARASCATEVRRRDRQIDGLKKQLGEAGRPRGSRNNPAVTTIHVTGDIGEERSSPTRAASIATDDYSLRNETNEFLATLAHNLSVENESILAAMRQAMSQLRDMSGWVGGDQQAGDAVRQPGWDETATELDSVMEHMKTILTNPSFVPLEEVVIREEEIARLKDGWFKMENRWKEAVHLIDGWRKRMAASGKPVCDEELKMGLRLSPIRVQDVAETTQARGFGLSVVNEESEPVSDLLQSSPCPSAEGSVHLMPALDDVEEPHKGRQDGEVSEAESSGYEDEAPVYDLDVDEPNVEILQQSTEMPERDPSVDSSPLPEPPRLSPLKNSASAGNRGALRNIKTRRKPGEFASISDENTRDIPRAVAPQPPPHRAKPATQLPQPLSANDKQNVQERCFSTSSLDDVLLNNTGSEPTETTAHSKDVDIVSHPEDIDLVSQPDEDQPSHNILEQQPLKPQNALHRTPLRVPSRLPLPRNADPAPQQSPLTMATIAAKLAASEREADAARVRAKLKAARSAREAKQPAADAPKPDEDVDPVKHDPTPLEEAPEEQPLPQPEKRKRDRKPSKTASRRRSTLSPWELESLMAGNMQ